MSVKHLEPRDVTKKGEVSIPTLEFLLANGWDINWPRNSTTRKPFMWYCINDRAKLVWCLRNGAKLKMPKNSDCRGRRSPPILEIVAREGDIATFEFLRSKGAPLQPFPHQNRVLHAAVYRGAVYRRDGSGDPANETEEHRKERAEHTQCIAMVRYLIDVVGFDANTLDQLPECRRGQSGAMGTPLEYAQDLWSDRLDTRELTWLLLDRGADLTPALKNARWGEDPTKWHHHFIKNVEEWEEQGGPERLREYQELKRLEEQKKKEQKCCVQ
ncbi:hypothetical protein Ptr902_06150 [Pyrenophora tritici-repentis]|nr:hypothetical protein Ptr902_13654 [Pyrenophora tritici-repentis]KAI2481769.1 hypothetical protein Ptr902_06150 [Pyrenophora tritici-repentis]